MWFRRELRLEINDHSIAFVRGNSYKSEISNTEHGITRGNEYKVIGFRYSNKTFKLRIRNDHGRKANAPWLYFDGEILLENPIEQEISF
jgi:hypothetical protein